MTDFHATLRAHDARVESAYQAYAEIAGEGVKRWTDDDLAYAATVQREGFLRTIGAAGDAMSDTPEYRGIVKAPTFAELQTRREDPFPNPCTLKSCGGRCSRCIRAAAIERNRARYGSNGDYPGASAAAAIDQRNGATPGDAWAVALLKGSTVRGGCPSCNAVQCVQRDAGEFIVSVRHVDGCPVAARYQGAVA